MIGGFTLLLSIVACCAASETTVSLDSLPPFQVTSVKFPDSNATITKSAKGCRQSGSNYTFVQENDDWFEINLHLEIKGQLNQRHFIRILEASETTDVPTILADITTTTNHTKSHIKLLTQARRLIISYSTIDRYPASSQPSTPEGIFRGRIDLKRDMSGTITANCSNGQLAMSVPSWRNADQTGLYLWGDDSVKCRGLLKQAQTLLLGGKEAVKGVLGWQPTVTARCSRGAMAVQQREFLVPFVTVYSTANAKCSRLFADFMQTIFKEF